LLRDAIGYALASADLVTPRLLSQPTPCSEWNLGMLLSHLSDSLDALTEGLTRGAVRLLASPGAEPEAQPAGIRVRCGRLLAAIPAAPAGRQIVIGDHELADGLLACAGAIEVTVHGWDISAACGIPRSIPDDLATALVRRAPILLPETAREGLFAPALQPPCQATASDRLLAFLGREWPRAACALVAAGGGRVPGPRGAVSLPDRAGPALPGSAIFTYGTFCIRFAPFTGILKAVF
jgi:uncharacterized protein (TIGR03086 family)